MLKTEAYAIHASLPPCPFCGNQLTANIRGGGDNAPNPKASCKTADCYGGRLPVLCLDIPEDVEAWGQRAAHAALSAQPDPAPAAALASPTFMTVDQACKWGWGQVREELGTEGWTTGDSCNFYGFFLHGWNYRGQYELQRAAAIAAVKQELTAAPIKEVMGLVEKMAFSCVDYGHKRAFVDPDCEAARKESGEVHRAIESKLRALLTGESAPAAQAIDSRDWRTPTTHQQRMHEAVTLLCRGNQPDSAMLEGWIDGTSEDLQHFAGQYGPAWAQGIGILDAAALMAEQPTEGVKHEMRAPQAQAAQQTQGGE